MKLELKHLAPYLPYGLKAVNFNTKNYGLKFLIKDINTSNITTLIDFSPSFKPILFPLSSLTKEITINGETFNPYDELTEGETVSMSLPDYAEDWNERTFYGFERYVNEWIDGDIHHLDFLPFGFIQKLLEWKIDVFSLIEAGLAEPVTEDFNPYK